MSCSMEEISLSCMWMLGYSEGCDLFGSNAAVGCDLFVCEVMKINHQIHPQAKGFSWTHLQLVILVWN